MDSCAGSPWLIGQGILVESLYAEWGYIRLSPSLDLGQRSFLLERLWPNCPTVWPKFQSWYNQVTHRYRPMAKYSHCNVWNLIWPVCSLSDAVRVAVKWRFVTSWVHLCVGRCSGGTATVTLCDVLNGTGCKVCRVCIPSQSYGSSGGFEVARLQKPDSLSAL